MGTNFDGLNIIDVRFGTIPAYRLYKGNTLVWQGLPTEYQKVEYLQSTGTQWIDTGVIPDDRTGISMKLSINDINSDKIRIGCRETSGDTRFWIASIRGIVYFGFGRNYGVTNDDFKIQSNIPFIAYLNYKNNRTCYVDDYTPLSLDSVSSITFTMSMVMFGRKYQSGISCSAQKIYSCQISQGNELIRDFIPCYRKLDNKPGMYDLVNNVFYTNDGTEEFIIGDNI